MAHTKQRMLELLRRRGCMKAVDLAALMRTTISDVEKIAVELQREGVVAIHENLICLIDREGREIRSPMYDKVVSDLSRNPYVKFVDTIEENTLLVYLNNNTLIVARIASKRDSVALLAKQTASLSRRLATKRCGEIAKPRRWRCSRVIPLVIQERGKSLRIVEGVAVVSLDSIHTFIADVVQGNVPVLLRKYIVGEL